MEIRIQTVDHLMTLYNQFTKLNNYRERSDFKKLQEVALYYFPEYFSSLEELDKKSLIKNEVTPVPLVEHKPLFSHKGGDDTLLNKVNWLETKLNSSFNDIKNLKEEIKKMKEKMDKMERIIEEIALP